jgi:hypothetical protein
MGIVVDLARWRGTRPVSDAGVDRIDPGMERLEMSIKRLDRLTSALLSGREPLEVSLETQLLALIGEISLGLLEDASRRAERLADRLAATAPSGTAVHGGPAGPR